ncbi:hypothetical protein B0H14DRAFT_2470800 [Mycena olivaceomarginata]|nr:hypothetical protein B0H14DRAFT_2470800 [Mycena olivaceomarginata]
MESRFSHQFNTNYIPSDEEIECIRKDLVSRAEELARIDERIRELSAQRDQIAAYISSHAALISHPRRLPPDIVGEIFVACLPTDRNAVMNAQEAPLLLGRICSRWRTIALSTPRLWASVHISFDFVLAKESRILAINDWLQLSAACPISLSFQLPASDSWGPPDNPSPGRKALVKCLTDSSARWRHAEFIDVFSPNAAGELADIIPSALESFRFKGSLWVLSQLKVFQASSPRALNLWVYSQPSESLEQLVAMPLVWNRLTHLTLGEGEGSQIEFSLGSLIGLLGCCAQLICFRFSLNITGDVAESNSQSLRFLETFTVTRDNRFWTPHTLTQLVGHVSMPQLRQFHVPTQPCRGPDSFFLVPLGTRSPLLQELTIYLESLTSQLLPQALQSLSSLTTLAVYHRDIRPNGWGDFELLDPGFERLLQDLTIFTWNPASDVLQKSILHDFIEGRMEFTPSFRRLRIVFRVENVNQTETLADPDIQSYLWRGVLVCEYPLPWPSPLPSSSPWAGILPGNHNDEVN